ncbi:asparagine--tRNA ligase [Neolewinella lacunae]|uniref:Asparagine--tRNA ligase n=1 Tax=Neolewinella lacunae TaxID=1517758 RepID=A0A923PQ96_9BACT|nr:asparagine--tRNA ligase [Neolewinella lacunae]MBC6995448.1 asparagine--tRNA ligase [Neolewinella lacunae]MDN3635036.1 asparagine--tRNA ligase [Neolewinella lacunae]
MILRQEIAPLLKNPPVGTTVTVMGWVRAWRGNRFMVLNDGSGPETLQVVVDADQFPEEIIRSIGFHACVGATGTLAESQGSGQTVELIASSIQIFGKADLSKYPLQAKAQSMEFLRENAQFRMRTNTFSAVFRIRHAVAYAINKYFHDRGFYYLHTPIITGNDAEGAGEMFRVTTLDPINPPLDEAGKVDYREDFFGKATNLTVSGQLQAEIGALALGKVYTFGPTFRAENSNTSRHLAEFWMIEPEIAFADIENDMDLAEDFVKYLINFCLDNYLPDLEFLDERIQQAEKNLKAELRRPMGLIEMLRFVVQGDFERITYTEAVELILASTPYKKKKFQFPVAWGSDLQAEHERWLVEQHFKKPVIVRNYPKDIKAFYMRLNDDGKTVAAMDILFPYIGEVIGGSQREEREEVLRARMQEMGVHEEELAWYLQLRTFGGAPHAGFGLGFERIVLFITGMGNIRDVIPFPRAPKTADF